MRVFVIGGTGLVGSNIVDRCQTANHTVLGTSRSGEKADIELDKTDPRATKRAITEFDPDLVVDTAAFHAVDDCESDRDRAWRVNAAGTRNAAVAADAANAHFVYLSTDYVFPGNTDDTPYVETDLVAPLNYYARTKYAGEQAAQIADQHTILRTSVIYGLASDNFVTWVLSELRAGNELDIVDDQVSTTTYAPDLARACLAVADYEVTGLYHAAGPTAQSRFEFTVQLTDVFGYDSNLISAITTKELGQKAPRPTDGSLESSRVYKAIDYRFREPETAFEEMCKQFDS